MHSAYTEGGRVDILISGVSDSKTKRYICIENKIYAKDQKNQLFRYHQTYGENGLILYLTLYGAEATQWSTGSAETKLELDKGYFRISYKKDILEWLIKCQSESIDVPNVRDVIGQYIYLIKKLTGQGMDRQEEKEFINLIAEVGKSYEQKDLIALKRAFDVFLKDVGQKLLRLQGKLKLDGSIDGFTRKPTELWNGEGQRNNLNSVLFIPLNHLPDGSEKDLKIRLSPKGWVVELWNGWSKDSKREEPLLLEMKYEATPNQMAVEVTKVVEGLMRKPE